MTKIDSRGPQEKGKPAQTTLHKQVGGDPGGGTRKSAFHNIPNRSGAVKNNMKDA
jgi:hypothetical protein